MQFTGHNLQMVEFGLELALDELHNRIATCPDVVEYAEDLERIYTNMARFQVLLEKVRRSPDFIPWPEED
jgi:hypothetical protein